MALGLPVLAWLAVGSRGLVVECETGYPCRTAEEFGTRLRALGLAGSARIARCQRYCAAVTLQWARIYGHYGQSI